MAVTAELILFNDGDARTPQAIKRLRRQNRDYSKYLGEPTIVMHRYTVEDVDIGIAKGCPGCFDSIYGNVRNDCQICYGVGFVSIADDPTDFITLDGRSRVEGDPGTGIAAPLFGGYAQPFMTFMIEPDKPTDEIKWSADGALTRTKQGEGYAPWTPTLEDNDLCVNVIVDRNWNILQEGDRYILKQVNPVTIRGFGRQQNFQEFLVAQQFEITRIVNEASQILYKVPVSRGITHIDATTFDTGTYFSSVEVQAVSDTATVSGISNIQFLEDYGHGDLLPSLNLKVNLDVLPD